MFLFLGKFAFCIHDTTCILWQFHYLRRMYYCGNPEMQKDRHFPSYTAAQMLWNGVWNKWHRKEITKLWRWWYPAVLGTQMIRFWYALKLQNPQGSRCEYVLVMKPLPGHKISDVGTDLFNSCRCIHFFDTLITGATTYGNPEADWHHVWLTLEEANLDLV